MKITQALVLFGFSFLCNRLLMSAEAGAIAGYKSNAPVFVHASSASTGETMPTSVHMPPVAEPGEHPCIFMTPDELTQLKRDLQTTARGKETLAVFMGIAGAMLTAPIDFPDPKGPLGQLNDRNDAVAKSHNRISYMCGDCGMAFALTGDVKYARKAADILIGYANLYSQYPEHRGVNRQDTGKVMGQRLSEAMWLMSLIESYDYIYNSGVLTDQNKHDIETKLLKAAVTFIRVKDPAAEVATRNAKSPNWRTAVIDTKKGVANWLFFYNAATLMVGATTGDKDMLDLGAADIRHLIHNGIGSDGMWLEGSISYQFFAMSALTLSMETAARQGINLWAYDNCRAKRLFDSPLRFAYPDWSAPGIGDSTRVRYGGADTLSYDYAWLRYGDPSYAALIEESPRRLHMSEGVYFPTRVFEALPKSKAVAQGSILLESLGYAIMRDDKSYVLLNYGPVGPVHSHFDKLNLVLYAVGDGGAGDEIGGEPKAHRYEDPLHGQWTKVSLAHNTMTVDGRSQVPTGGKLLVFESTPVVKVMRCVCDSAYPGAQLDRTALVTPDAVIDLYQGRSSSSHTWDRTLRYQGSLDTLVGVPNVPSVPASGTTTAASPAKMPGTPLGAADGYEHFNVLSTLPADNAWAGVWKTAVGNFDVTLGGAPKQKLFVGIGPDSEQMGVVRQEGNSAAFAATYQMAAWGNPVQSVNWLPSDEGVRACEITQKDGTKTLVVVGSGAPWQVSGWKSDASIFYLRQTAAKATAMICGGTSAVGPAGAFRLNAAGNALARGSEGKLSIVSQWAPTAGGALK